MLVLSRRPGQKVVFPSLGIEIEVLRSRGTVTKLGIQAPAEIPVLREEVLARQESAGASNPPPTSRQSRHDWANALNGLMLRLQLLQCQLELGQASKPEVHLAELCAELTNLERATADAALPSNPPRVLIVEDQANERELLATCLRMRGLDVATAGNGREAFDYLHEHELPDLVLLDMRMPDVDGPTLLQSIRDDIRMQKLRVFAVTGLAPSEFKRQSLPIDGWFSKPVRIDALLQAARYDRQPAVVPM